jgi:hypothetical protein
MKIRTIEASGQIRPSCFNVHAISHNLQPEQLTYSLITQGFDTGMGLLACAIIYHLHKKLIPINHDKQTFKFNYAF